MFKPLEIFVGLRYTRAKRRNHFISFISLISMLGVAVGVAALITVISVMNGFEKELRERILGMTAHATIRGDGNQLKDWEHVAKLAAQHPQVVGYAPFIAAEGMLSVGDHVQASMVRGILPAQEPQVSDVGEKMVHGELHSLVPGEFGIILGKDLARLLGVMRGDKVTLIVPQANVTPAGIMPRMKRFTVVGIFEAGMYEYDSALALIHIDDAGKLFRMPGEVSGVRLKLADMFQSMLVVKDLIDSLSGEYWVSDWTRQHSNFFRAVQMEKTVMSLILTLIVAVAAFNLLSTMVMTVVDKQSDIAILRTLGISPGSIMGIFMVQGSVVGVVGTLLGTVGGVLLALNVPTIVPALEQLLGTQFLSAEVYYISELPSEMRWSDVYTISSTAFVLCLLATVYPAWRASRVQPAEALRYE
ncbi:MAG: lipoprotein-releasing ABC transporter permease subunit [Gammaproteobacteria bacterium]|nr:lipoprotein-releasing ABC transporter permease subunit [Gammaproteobacteria bacterium]